MLNGEYENNTILLVIKKRKVIVLIYHREGNIYYLGSSKHEKVLLPKGEKAVVIATCYKKGYNYTEDNVFFCDERNNIR